MGSSCWRICSAVALICVLLVARTHAQSSTSPQEPAAATQAQSPNAPGTAPAPEAGQVDTSAEVAKKLANPIASIISVPLESNFEFGAGPNEDGFRYTLNLQPSVPFALNRKWNLISRTVVPIILQSEAVGATGRDGLADTTQSFFFSPSSSQRFTWGLGPAFLVPTATDDSLGSKKFGIGPTLVVLKQHKGWTVGALTNHVWSVAGDDERSDVSSTLLQPFIKYTTKTAWTIALSSESTYDWTLDKASVPINLVVTKVVRFGGQRVSIGGGSRCWANSPSGGPSGCGIRILVVPVFPKK
jgi:hypothetical protein